MRGLQRIMQDWQVDVLIVQGIPPQEDVLGSGADWQRVAKELGMTHHVSAPAPPIALPGADGSGYLILSRYAFASTRQVDGTPESLGAPAQGGPPLPPARALGAELRWGKGTVWLWTTRAPMGGSEAEAFAWMQALMGVMNEGDAPFILAVEMGLPPQSEPVRFLAKEWRDAWPEAGSGLGYTAPLPVPKRRTSYFFISRDVRLGVERIYPLLVAEGEGGMNLPLFADLTLTEPPPPKPEAAVKADDPITSPSPTPDGGVPAVPANQREEAPLKEVPPPTAPDGAEGNPSRKRFMPDWLKGPSPDESSAPQSQQIPAPTPTPESLESPSQPEEPREKPAWERVLEGYE